MSGIIKTSGFSSEQINEGTLVAIQKDQIGWYLYLVHTYLYEPHKYEFYQGARVIPIFHRLGTDLDLLKNIEGINKKMRDLVRKRPSEADAILFEILTALLWTRNGWTVKIIAEGKSGKTPDFLVSKGMEQWQIECKRQMKTSDYTYKETNKRQILISQISKILLHYNVLLDITFHVELISLPDTYLYDILKDIIPKNKISGRIISNEKVDIDFSFVDISAFQRHVKEFFVKNNSPQHFELIASKPIDHSSFTSGFIGNFFYVGEDNANNLYISDIRNAYGVHCYCDASEAIFAKARDVRNQINDAINQFSSDTNSIIHIGMETFDGPEVERARLEKIITTMENINISKDQNRLCWIYYHYFQSYSRSYQNWFFDETVSTATSFINPVPLLKKTFLVIPEDELSIKDASHWERDLP
ncbi:hypothetical protein [Flavobacterium sp. CGRL2]